MKKLNTTGCKLVIGTLIISGLLLSGCGYSGGRSAEEIARENDLERAERDNLAKDRETLRAELIKIPSNQQLTDKPYRLGYTTHILERQSNGSYNFVYEPVADAATKRLPAANTVTAAILNYIRVPAGDFKVVGEDRIVPGYKLDAEVILIDHSIPAVIHKKTFKGEEPKPSLASSNTIASNRGDNEVLGKKPIDEIRKWLDSLPVRD
jgi:outer membrane murein-binding lipoprotein Lpp